MGYNLLVVNFINVIVFLVLLLSLHQHSIHIPKRKGLNLAYAILTYWRCILASVATRCCQAA